MMRFVLAAAVALALFVASMAMVPVGAWDGFTVAVAAIVAAAAAAVFLWVQ